MGKVDLVFVLEIYQSNNVMQTVLFSPAYNAANEPNLRNSGILAVMAKALSPLLHRGLSGRATERSAGVRTNTIQGVKKRKEVASSFWIVSTISLSQVLTKNPKKLLFSRVHYREGNFETLQDRNIFDQFIFPHSERIKEQLRIDLQTVTQRSLREFQEEEFCIHRYSKSGVRGVYRSVAKQRLSNGMRIEIGATMMFYINDYRGRRKDDAIMYVRTYLLRFHESGLADKRVTVYENHYRRVPIKINTIHHSSRDTKNRKEHLCGINLITNNFLKVAFIGIVEV
ncbi:hypothetical protein V1478_013356 [Vespula squamosa]|uniref:Uncharacterized protein n=1 Tax=Vespula squamosa TaxID=30214 RepID=A0ABD2AAL8_VESSQ